MIKLGFGSSKGGCGKTTSSISAASCLQAQGFKTVVLDLDPDAQGSALWWLDQAEVSFDYAAVSGSKSYAKTIIGLEEAGYAYCVSDFPPNLHDPDIWKIYAMQDLIMIPLKTGLLDITRAKEAYGYFKEEGITTGMFFNEVDSRRMTDARNTVTELRAEGYPMFRSIVRQLAVFEKVAGDHGEIMTYKDPKSKEAVVDVKNLMQEILEFQKEVNDGRRKSNQPGSQKRQ